MHALSQFWGSREPCPRLHVFCVHCCHVSPCRGCFPGFRPVLFRMRFLLPEFRTSVRALALCCCVCCLLYVLLEFLHWYSCCTGMGASSKRTGPGLHPPTPAKQTRYVLFCHPTELCHSITPSYCCLFRCAAGTPVETSRLVHMSLPMFWTLAKWLVDNSCRRRRRRRR